MHISPRPILIALTALLPIGCGLLGGGSREPVRSDAASATLRDRSGREVGTASLVNTAAGVLVSASLTGIGQGTHAMHVHQTGLCTPDFEAAGAHFNPDSRQHGFRNGQGPHAGDMPNVHVSSNGSVRVDVIVPGVTISGGRPLLDGDGAALVVHASADDYMTEPSGNSGDRIACGVITAR
jgi:superoxide dismutase, Cu-Zn family